MTDECTYKYIRNYSVHMQIIIIYIYSPCMMLALMSDLLLASRLTCPRRKRNWKRPTYACNLVTPMVLYYVHSITCLISFVYKLLRLLRAAGHGEDGCVWWWKRKTRYVVCRDNSERMGTQIVRVAYRESEMSAIILPNGGISLITYL